MRIGLLFILFCTHSLFGAVNLNDPQEVISELVNANYQKNPELTILQLFELDELFFQNVSNDLLTLIQENNPSYATDPKHLSYWSRPEGVIRQYSLLNVSGRLNDYSTDHNRSIKHKAFAHQQRYPSLAQFIALFPHAINFRINILDAKSCFTQHQENICFLTNSGHKPALRVRFHLPIHTNPEAVMLMEGDGYHFNPGVVYFFHNGCVHDGMNMSATDARIHLIWDMLLTEETFERMFARTIPMENLNALPKTRLDPIASVGIDPDYKRTARSFPYETALSSTFSPIQ